MISIVSNRPILVTGAPRSGTSWVGNMIGLAPRVRYVHEPFNISGNPCHCGVSFKYWFHYLYSENWYEFEEHLRHTIYPAYNLVGLLNSITLTMQTKRIRTIKKYVQAYFQHRVVIKDPLAVFSAETLADRFDMNVVIVIRHPAAVVSSYKSLNWTHPFSHFLSQPRLMEEQLTSFRSEIEDFARNDHDIVDQVALLWKLIHYMVIKYRETQTEWIFVRYEELVSDPIEGYRKIFNQTNLPFSDRTHRVIQAHRLQEQLSNTADPYAIKQNPHQVISKWKKNLTSVEINRIRKRVEDISSAFYTDEDWNLQPISSK